MWLGTVQRRIARRPGNGLFGLALLLASCTGPAEQAAGPFAPPDRPDAAAQQRSAAPQVDVAPLAAVHKANPGDPAATLAYARALRQSGTVQQAVAVLDKASALRPADKRLILERGLLALDLGEPAKAEPLLRKAQDDKAPSWRLHSALGTALASRGKQQEAQVEFAKALALAPDHPSILNNLALSYALDGKTDEAERLLRKARLAKSAPDPAKVQQNLALVLGLNGKYEESRRAGSAALEPDRAQENVAYLQALASTRPAPSEASSKISEAVNNTGAAVSKASEAVKTSEPKSKTADKPNAAEKPSPAEPSRNKPEPVAAADISTFSLIPGLKPSTSLPPSIYNLGGPKPAD